MVSTAAAERFLAAPWLADVDSAARQELLDVLTEHRATAGAILLEQGHPNDHIAFLIDGTATVYRDRPNAPAETLTTLAAPSLFGLTSFFRPTPPNFNVRATSAVWFLSLDHDAHAILRRIDPRATEQLALMAVRIMADRFDMLDRKISEDLAAHPENHPRVNEWSSFRARLFDESNI